jgi:hypothetical protein
MYFVLVEKEKSREEGFSGIEKTTQGSQMQIFVFPP